MIQFIVKYKMLHLTIYVCLMLTQGNGFQLECMDRYHVQDGHALSLQMDLLEVMMASSYWVELT
jgi:hypothetical protein